MAVYLPTIRTNVYQASGVQVIASPSIDAVVNSGKAEGFRFSKMWLWCNNITQLRKKFNVVNIDVDGTSNSRKIVPNIDSYASIAKIDDLELGNFSIDGLSYIEYDILANEELIMDLTLTDDTSASEDFAKKYDDNDSLQYILNQDTAVNLKNEKRESAEDILKLDLKKIIKLKPRIEKIKPAPDLKEAEEVNQILKSTSIEQVSTTADLKEPEEILKNDTTVFTPTLGGALAGGYNNRFGKIVQETEQQSQTANTQNAVNQTKSTALKQVKKQEPEKKYKISYKYNIPIIIGISAISLLLLYNNKKRN